MIECLNRFYERTEEWSADKKAETGKRNLLDGPHLGLWHSLQHHLAPFHQEAIGSDRQALRRHRGREWAMEGAVLVLVAEDPVTKVEDLGFPALGEWGSEFETYDAIEELALLSREEFFGHRGMITWQATRPFTVHSVAGALSKEHQDGLIWALARYCDADLRSLADSASAPPPPSDPNDGKPKREGDSSNRATRSKRKKKKRGPSSDPKEDKRIDDAYHAGECRTNAECAKNLGLKEAEVYAARERHRKR